MDISTFTNTNPTTILINTALIYKSALGKLTPVLSLCNIF